MTDKEAKELVIQITNELFAMGLLTATGGNISATANEEGTIWITPSRMYKGGLCDADLVRIDQSCKVLEGERPPSVEWQMHFASYAARPGTTGAVHTHAPVATAFGITNQTFPPINTDAVFLRDTVTVPWIMPGSKELARASDDRMARQGNRADPGRPGRQVLRARHVNDDQRGQQARTGHGRRPRTPPNACSAAADAA